jgi:hypothetical protein
LLTLAVSANPGLSAAERVALAQTLLLSGPEPLRAALDRSSVETLRVVLGLIEVMSEGRTKIKLAIESAFVSGVFGYLEKVLPVTEGCVAGFCVSVASAPISQVVQKALG